MLSTISNMFSSLLFPVFYPYCSCKLMTPGWLEVPCQPASGSNVQHLQIREIASGVYSSSHGGSVVLPTHCIGVAYCEVRYISTNSVASLTINGSPLTLLTPIFRTDKHSHISASFQDNLTKNVWWNLHSLISQPVSDYPQLVFKPPFSVTVSQVKRQLAELKLNEAAGMESVKEFLRCVLVRNVAFSSISLARTSVSTVQNILPVPSSWSVCCFT